MCNILGANFLHNEQSIVCDKEVLKSLTTKMPSIFPQRAEEAFPAPKESLLNVLHRKLIYQFVL